MSQYKDIMQNRRRFCRRELLGMALLWCVDAPKAFAWQSASGEPASFQVTLSGTYPHIATLLAEITRGSNGQRRLRAVKSAGWPQVIAYAQDAPGDQVLEGIAALFHFRWNGGRGYPLSGGATNTLSQSETARVYEERLCREQLERGTSPLFTLAKYARTPPAEWKQRLDDLKGAPPDDPLLRSGNLESLAKPHLHAQLEILDTLTPRERQLLLDQEEITVAGGAVTVRQWQLLRRMDDLPGPRSEWVPGESDRLLSPKEVQANLSRKFELYRETGLPLRIWRNPATGFVPRYELGYNLLHIPPPAPRLPVRGCPYPIATPAADAPPAQEVASEPVTFPKEFKLPAPVYGRVPWGEVMKALAESLPPSLVLLSDDNEDLIDWREWEERLATPPGIPNFSGKTLEEGLDALCESQERLWWRDGNVLFFRSQTWFLRQRYQVPPPVLARLTSLASELKNAGNNKKRTAEAIAKVLRTLGDLTHEQLIGLLSGRDTQASERYSGGFDARTIRPHLRLFQTLSAGQQRQLLLGDGLGWHDLNPTQQNALIAHSAGFNGIWVTRKTDDIRLTVTPSVELKRVNEVIRATGGIEEAKEGEPRTPPGVIVSVSFRFLPNAWGGKFAIFLPDLSGD